MYKILSPKLLNNFSKAIIKLSKPENMKRYFLSVLFSKTLCLIKEDRYDYYFICLISFYSAPQISFYNVKTGNKMGNRFLFPIWGRLMKWNLSFSLSLNIRNEERIIYGIKSLFHYFL